VDTRRCRGAASLPLASHLSYPRQPIEFEIDVGRIARRTASEGLQPSAFPMKKKDFASGANCVRAVLYGSALKEPSKDIKGFHRIIQMTPPL
jgi:hypothetical protein